MWNHSMQGSVKNLFTTTVIEHFKKSKQAVLYDTIHVLQFDHNTRLKQDLIELKKHSGCNRLGVLLFTTEPHYFEPGNKISRQWIRFKDVLLEYQIFNCDFFITCLFSDSAHDDSIKYLNTNHYDWSFNKFDVDIIVNKTKHSNLENNAKKLFIEECYMKFSHLNFTHRMHRQLFSKFLIKEKLVHNNLVAINDYRKIVEGTKGLAYKDKHTLVETVTNDGWFYNKHLLDLWRDVPLEYHRHPDINDNLFAKNYTFLNKAAFNIVSETVFDYPFPNYSEKTIQSLLSKRPFIMIGSCRNLRHLRDKGFKTFGYIINESYDDIEDPNERLEAVMQLVLELSKKPQKQLNDMVYAVKDVLIHNYSLMLEKIKNFTNITE